MTRYFLVVGLFTVALGTLVGCSGGGPAPSTPVTDEQAQEQADGLANEMMQAEGVDGGSGSPSP